MKKLILLLVLFPVLFSVKAEITLTVFYKNGIQKKVTVPDNLAVHLSQYYNNRTFVVKAYGDDYEPVSEKDKQEIKRLSKQVGDGTIENEKTIYDDGKCSYESKIEIIDEITGIKID